jgi:hypothetical protein
MRSIQRRIMVCLASVGLALGAAVIAPVESALAAPSCPAGMTCFWTNTNGGGNEYRYSYTANHTHKTASVFYNYNTNSISFWTANGGKGTMITHYTTSQRGFRNWSSSNHNICRSHVDRYT